MARCFLCGVASLFLLYQLPLTWIFAKVENADTSKCRRCPHVVSLFFLCYESRATTEAEIEYQIYIWRITHDDGMSSFFLFLYILLILYLIVACLLNTDRVGEKRGIWENRMMFIAKSERFALKEKKVNEKIWWFQKNVVPLHRIWQKRFGLELFKGFWKVGWVAETTSLLNWRTGYRTGGSNPPPSASKSICICTFSEDGGFI